MQVVPRDAPLFCGTPQEIVTDCSIDLQCPSKTNNNNPVILIQLWRYFIYVNTVVLLALKIHKDTDFDLSPWKLVGMV